jgi:response regulator of citrate/malate metabolism
MMEDETKKLEQKQDVLTSLLELYKYTRGEIVRIDALNHLNTVSNFVREVIAEQNADVTVAHPMKGKPKVAEAKVIKAIDLLSKEWLSAQQLAGRVNLSKSSVVTALMPAVRKRAIVATQRMGKLAKTKYRVTSIG